MQVILKRVFASCFTFAGRRANMARRRAAKRMAASACSHCLTSQL
jgi:hypothetical protein